MSSPKWATPQRQATLLNLFARTGGLCVYGHHPCPYPDHHYEYYIDYLVSKWSSQDRAERQALWERERQLMHRMPDSKGWKRRFDPVHKEQFFEQQPPYYLEDVGVNPLTFHRTAKIRLASTNIRLFVDVAKRKVTFSSRNQRRKARALGLRIQAESIYELCDGAAIDYYKSR